MIERQYYMSKVVPFIGTELVKVMTGVRRSGKSMMLTLIQEELLRNRGIDSSQIVAVNFEELGNEELLDYRKLNDFLEGRIRANLTETGTTPAAAGGQQAQKTYIFLDEVQAVDQFEKVVNSLRATYGDQVDIYITGSNARFLSGELATLLGGRYVQCDIYPFTFSEYVTAKESIQIHKTDSEFFQDYLVDGGVPFLATHNLDPAQRDNYLLDLYNSIVLKDVIQREGVRDANLLERVYRFALGNIGRMFSSQAVVRYLKSQHVGTSTNTVNNYLRYGANAFFFVPISKTDVQGKGYLGEQTKNYVVDHGLREAVLGRNTVDVELILENIVLMELKARGYKVNVGDVQGKEIDFVATRTGRAGSETLYVQVSYLLADEATREREFASLKRIPDNHPKVVLSLDPLTRDEDGIRHRNLVEWLLDVEGQL